MFELPGGDVEFSATARGSLRLKSDSRIMVVPFDNDVTLSDLVWKSRTVPARPVLITTMGFKRFVETCLLYDGVLEEVGIDPDPTVDQLERLKGEVVLAQQTAMLGPVWAVVRDVLLSYPSYVEFVRVRLPQPTPQARRRHVRVTLHANGTLAMSDGEGILPLLDAALAKAVQ